MEILKSLIISSLPALITGFLAYLVSNKNLNNQIKIVKANNEHEINKLMEQHKIDIENLEKQHKLEMKIKEKEYLHEKEMQELKSRDKINEKNQELMSTSMSGIMGNLLQDIITGKRKAEDIEKMSKQFQKKD